MAAQSRRSSTLGMYSARLRLYGEWCQNHEVTPDSATVGEVADFLLHQFQLGKLVNTVKGFRSAIAAVHLGFEDGSTVSTAAPLEHLIKGMFLQRPVVRVLSPPWSIQTVLDTLAKFPFEPLETAPLKELSFKLAFLLSAASARRRSALHALSLKEGHIRFERGGVRLVPDPSFLAKNQTLEFLPEPIFLPSLSMLSDTREDRVWCPVRCLLAYIKRTQSIRANEKALFISFQKPHHRVSRDTVSRWITQAIIYNPKSLFANNNAHAHQVRAVSTSVALFAGVPMIEIMRAAVWKTPSTFVAAYLRDMHLEEGSLARAVLRPGR